MSRDERVWKWIQFIAIMHGDAGLSLGYSVDETARIFETEGDLRIPVSEWRIVVDCSTRLRAAALVYVTTGSDRKACQERAYFVSV